MIRTFTYFHDGREPSVMVLLPLRYNGVVFISGADFGHVASPAHGRWASRNSQEGEFIDVEFKYHCSAPRTHFQTFRKNQETRVWHALGGPARLIERTEEPPAASMMHMESRPIPPTPHAWERPVPTTLAGTVALHPPPYPPPPPPEGPPPTSTIGTPFPTNENSYWL